MRTSAPRYLSIISRGTYLLVPPHRRKALRPWTLQDLKARKASAKVVLATSKVRKAKVKAKAKARNAKERMEGLFFGALFLLFFGALLF